MRTLYWSIIAPVLFSASSWAALTTGLESTSSPSQIQKSGAQTASLAAQPPQGSLYNQCLAFLQDANGNREKGRLMTPCNIDRQSEYLAQSPPPAGGGMKGTSSQCKQIWQATAQEYTRFLADCKKGVEDCVNVCSQVTPPHPPSEVTNAGTIKKYCQEAGQIVMEEYNTQRTIALGNEAQCVEISRTLNEDQTPAVQSSKPPPARAGSQNATTDATNASPAPVGSQEPSGLSGPKDAVPSGPKNPVREAAIGIGAGVGMGAIAICSSGQCGSSGGPSKSSAVVDDEAGDCTKDFFPFCDMKRAKQFCSQTGKSPCLTCARLNYFTGAACKRDSEDCIKKISDAEIRAAKAKCPVDPIYANPFISERK